MTECVHVDPLAVEGGYRLALTNDRGLHWSGGLPETRFLTRVLALETRLTELRAQLDDLRESDRTEVLVAPTAEVMRHVKETFRGAMLNGTPGQRKALLKELVV